MRAWCTGAGIVMAGIGATIGGVEIVATIGVTNTIAERVAASMIGIVDQEAICAGIGTTTGAATRGSTRVIDVSTIAIEIGTSATGTIESRVDPAIRRSRTGWVESSPDFRDSSA
jgi:hypothetical protein